MKGKYKAEFGIKSAKSDEKANAPCQNIESAIFSKNIKKEDVLSFKELISPDIRENDFYMNLENFLDYKQSSSLCMDSAIRELGKDYIISTKNNYSKAVLENDLEHKINQRIQMFSSIFNSSRNSLNECYLKFFKGKSLEYFNKSLQVLIDDFFTEIDFSKKEAIDEKMMTHAGIYLSAALSIAFEYGKKIKIDLLRISPFGLKICNYAYSNDDNHGLPYIGSFMQKGELKILGPAGICLGFMMEGGSIDCKGASNKLMGYLMNGGKLKANDSFGEIGYFSKKGWIFLKKGREKKVKECKAKILPKLF